jgi:triacylglycerol lipase
MAASNAAPSVADNYAQTRYPIVLVHGLSGASSDMDAFRTDLRSHGAKVYAVQLSGFQGEEGPNGRGEQLLAYVKSVLAETGAQKVNLVGHSQGGLSSRYVAYVAADLIASVTTIGTPHRGSETADFVDELTRKQPIAAVRSMIGAVVNLVTFLSGNWSDRPEDSLAAFQQLTTTYSAGYNRRIPSAGLGAPGSCSTGGSTETLDGQTHLLYSWIGSAFQQRSLFGRKIVVDTSVGAFDFAALANANRLNFYATSLLMFARGSGTNDGLVSVCSSLYGSVVGTGFKWNHVGEISPMVAAVGGLAENPVALMRVHANRLKNQGV